MKKIITLMAIYGLSFMQSCLCPNNGFSVTHVTIETARGLFYSFDQNDIFPYLDFYDRTKLGISVLSDSISERLEVSELAPSLFNSAYACQDPHETEYVNFIDSVNIFTKYNFDPNHLAGSKINDIVKPMDIMGETTNGINIEELVIINQHFKFSTAPTFDSMQFVITGRITEKGIFTTQTDLIVLTD